MNRIRWFGFLIAALLGGGAGAADKPHVRLLATGGTIAGAQPADGSGHSYRAGVVGVEALVDAVVVTHGTDTLEEPAFLLSLTIGGDKPVILTGSIRPSTAVGAEGPANLLQAVTVAVAPATRSRGVMVVGNNTIHGARLPRVDVIYVNEA